MKRVISIAIFLLSALTLFADPLSRDPLYQAMNTGDLSAVKKALANGADPNKKYPYYEGHLFTAASITRLDLFQLLLSAGADPHIVTDMGENLLHAACWNPGNKKIIKILLDLGVDTEQKNKESGYTPFLLACSTTYINWPAAKQVIEAGANVQAVDKEGKNGIMIGILSDMQLIPVHFIEYLLKKGLDINAQDKEGRTALMYTCMGVEYLRKQTKYLMENGSDLSIRDIHGNTALHYMALASHQTDLLAAMAHKYKNINIRNADGATPLTLAREHYAEASFQYLKSIGGIEKPVSFQIHPGDKVYGYYDGRLWVKARALQVSEKGVLVEYDDQKQELLKKGKVFKDQFPYFIMAQKGVKVLARHQTGYTMPGTITASKDKTYEITFDDGTKRWHNRTGLVVIQ